MSVALYLMVCKQTDGANQSCGGKVQQLWLRNRSCMLISRKPIEIRGRGSASLHQELHRRLRVLGPRRLAGSGPCGR